MVTKLKFDKKRMLPKLDVHSSYRCNYSIHELEKPPDFSNKTETDGVACYSGFFSRYNLNKKPSKAVLDKKAKQTYLSSMFLINPKENENGFKLNIHNVYRWVELCEKYKLLPSKGISTKKIEILPKTEKVPELFRITMTVCVEGVFQPTLYVWLDNFRHARENQSFVSSILYMYYELGINFYVAYILSSYLNISNSGHHCLPISTSIYEKATSAASPIGLNNESVLDLKLASLLYRIANNFPELAEKYKNKDNVAEYVTKLHSDKKERASYWYCSKLILNYAGKENNLTVKLAKLKHKNVNKIVCAKEEKERVSLYKKIR